MLRLPVERITTRSFDLTINNLGQIIYFGAINKNERLPLTGKSSQMPHQIAPCDSGEQTWQIPLP